MTEKKKNTLGTVRWVIVLVLAFLLILFAIQNNKEVELGLVFGTRKLPLSVIMIINILVGLFFGIILMMSFLSKLRKKNKAQAKEIEKLENRLDGIQKKMMDIDNDLNG